MLNRIIFITLVILGASTSLHASQLPCSPGYDNIGVIRSAVAMAVSAAPDGTVICLQAGSATGANSWTSQLTINPDLDKCVEIRGHGTIPLRGSAGETIIEINTTGAGIAGWSMSTSSCTIDNIKFVVNETDPIAYSVILWARNGSGTLPWIAHHNDFQVTGRCDGTRFIAVADHHGVIYRNKFTTEIIGAPSDGDGVNHGCKGANTNINAIAHDITDDGSYWASASTFGDLDTTGENLYVEDNYFENFNVALDANSSSRIVWRNNIMRNSSWVDHGYDSSPTGDRQQEAYNNEWICDEPLSQGAYFYTRGATHRIFNNTFPVRDPAACGISNSTAANIGFANFKLFECDVIGGWPGQYNGATGDTAYPMSHQVGWGWKSSGTQNVGSTTAQDQPGAAPYGYPTNGFDQILSPSYVFNNTNTSGNPLTYIDDWRPGTCRAMAYSNTGKGGGAATTLVIPSAAGVAGHTAPYANAGQEAVVVFSDLVGGSTPTVDDNLGNTWSALQGGTNGSQRLTIWHSHITTGGALVVTIHFGSSTAARAGTVVIMRGMAASPVDANPSANTSANASPYQGPSSGTLAQTNEIVLGYYALNGPIDDNINATSPDIRATSCDVCTAAAVGIAGTTGSTATTNTVVGVTYRLVTSTSSVQPQITDGTTRNGITGTVSFKVLDNDNTNLDFHTRDFIQYDREIYTQNDSFTGTSGTGTGDRAHRPAAGSSNNGVGYWDTDHGGNWDTSNGSANDGCLDVMVAGAWDNCNYTPAVHPNLLADVTGSSGGSCTPDHLAFSVNPSGSFLNVAFSATVTIYDSNGVKCDTATNTVTVANKDGTCTGMNLGGTKTGAATAGDFATMDLTLDAAGACTLRATASGLTGADSTPFAITVAGTGGGIGARLKLNIR